MLEAWVQALKASVLEAWIPDLKANVLEGWVPDLKACVLEAWVPSCEEGRVLEEWVLDEVLLGAGRL